MRLKPAPIMNNARKNQIRTTVLLELNSAFTKLFDDCMRHGDAEDEEFLQELVGSIKECVAGETKQTADTDFNS